MPSSKSVLIIASSLLIGCALGFTGTRFVLKKEFEKSNIELSAGYTEIATINILEQLSLLEGKDTDEARIRLNNHLAWCVIFAKKHLRDQNYSSIVSANILKITSEQRKKPVYQNEEAKVEKEIAEPRYVM